MNNTAVVVDGNLMAFKAFSTRTFTSKDGRPTSVIHGLLQTLNTAYTRNQYDKLLVCWDYGKSKKRLKRDKNYKANRGKMESDDYKRFKEEMKMAQEFLETLKIPQLKIYEVEGDDMIGIASRHLMKQGFNVIVVSEDRDLLQLINSKVKVWRPKTKKLFDKKMFAKEYEGLKPKDLIKMKSLMGDKGDNIPSIPGIGTKTAIWLVKQYPTLQDKNIDINDIKSKRYRVAMDKVLANFEQISMAYDLAKIALKPEELEIKKHIKECKRLLKNLDNELPPIKMRKFQKLLKQLQLGSALNRVERASKTLCLNIKGN